MSDNATEALTAAGLAKVPTGIQGLDEVTGGGFPRGRPTLVTGGAGCGKTLLGVEFLVHGALDYGEPGVLLAFEESGEELAANVVTLGFDLAQMEADGLLVIDAFRVDPAEVVEAGSYDLDGLFIRLACAVDAIGAKRVVLDTIEVLFGVFKDEATVRAELGRLFRWLKQRGLTAVVTGEKGGSYLTRHGIEEYVSDRDHPGSPGHRTDLNPAASRCEVPGLAPWHERVPLSHHRQGPCCAAAHVARADPRGFRRAGVDRGRPP